MKKSSHPIARPDAESLARAAFTYLGRYAASEASLRRILHNKVRKAERWHPDVARGTEAHKTLCNAIETIIAKHKKSGVLNDLSYAEIKATGMRRAGRSRRYILQALSKRGVDTRVTQDALSQTDSDRGTAADAELRAAQAYAKRRRLGPFFTGKMDEDRRRKHFAAFARAGYSLDIARKVLGGSAEEIEDLQEEMS